MVSLHNCKGKPLDGKITGQSVKYEMIIRFLAGAIFSGSDSTVYCRLVRKGVCDEGNKYWIFVRYFY